MWLIHTTTLRLKFVDLYDTHTVRYAILSHTWEDGEVSFQEFQTLDSASLKKGFKKIEMTCRLARQRGLNYAWVDTCCIDKTNNVELTEAINSMFRWYEESEVCFTYLSDFQSRLIEPYQLQEHLSQCRWFTRNWTLQELIAPRHVEFLDFEWSLLGQKTSLADKISTLISIDKDVLLDSNTLKNVPVARKMSWAANRKTTRTEDMAYCLTGIFNINMPMIYGEGHKAFYRLQEEIIKETNDLSLFAWTSQYSEHEQEHRGIFADSPLEFADCGTIQLMHPMDRFDQEFAITNKGLRIEAILTVDYNEFVLNLHASTQIFKHYIPSSGLEYISRRPLEAMSGQDLTNYSLRAVQSGIMGNQHVHIFLRT